MQGHEPWMQLARDDLKVAKIKFVSLKLAEPETGQKVIF